MCENIDHLKAQLLNMMNLDKFIYWQINFMFTKEICAVNASFIIRIVHTNAVAQQY